MANPTLSLMAFPQSWDGTKLTLNVLLVPAVDPTADNQIAPGTPAFAKAKPVLGAKLITNLNNLPDTTDPATKSFPMGVTAPANALSLFNQLKASFQFNPSPPAPQPRRDLTSVKKYLPPSYRSAFPFEQPRTRLAVTGKEFECAIRDEGNKAPPKKPPPSPLTTWGQVLSMALRQPLLARALGLFYSAHITPAAADVANGGWLYVALDAGGDYGGAVSGGAIVYYAARLPPLTAARSLFAAVLFPVTNAAGGVPAPSGNFDDIFTEAEGYDDGFTKVVHCAQPQVIDAASHKPDTLVPAADAGIQLGWDDEQVPIWLQRQISTDATDVSRRAPLGVLGYRVDVHEPPDTDWHSLQTVLGHLTIGGIDLGSADNTELQIETAPARFKDVAPGSPQDYWLPAYFAMWRGLSLVIGDDLAYRLSGAGTPQPRKLTPSIDPKVKLRYGHTYEFRVRLADLTGGGPGAGAKAINPAPAPVASCGFRRFVPPKAVRPDLGKTPPPAPTSFKVLRPLLSYPEFVFAGDPTDPTTLLPLLTGPDKSTDLGVPDPDVKYLHITVEVRVPTGEIGDLDGPYRVLYTTTRPFPATPADALTVELSYQDLPALKLTAPPPVVPASGPLPIPTARDVRIRLEPLCKEDPGLTYFGNDSVRTGLTYDFKVRKESADETSLFTPTGPAVRLNAIFLQPDRQVTANQKVALTVLGDVQPGGAVSGTSVVQRLAQKLGLEVQGLTLSGKDGQRVVFGASGALRHTLSGDHSQLNFASQNELLGHWIGAIRLGLNRDWTWDGLQDQSFLVARDGVTVGSIDVRQLLGGTATTGPALDRAHTELVFFDAVDPNPEPGKFPGELHVKWTVTPQLKGTPTVDPPVELAVRLPVTVTPAQVPALASAGIALSDYQRAKDYSSTEPRQRMLWLEFAEEIADSANDVYFGRVLAYAPDPLLVPGHNGEPAPDEPALAIDPELIRVIVPGQSEDKSGLDAMQALIPSSSKRHFLLPLPPGLDAEALELFGFFTYELRVGHVNEWSTAQGRFGRPLRVTGVQHPAPHLHCLVTHLPETVVVTAPFATPVTPTGTRADTIRGIPAPQTQLWVLLYTQVTQVDGADRRNVLLARQQAVIVRDDKNELHPFVNRDVYGRVVWTQDVIDNFLDRLCLPPDSPLSVLAVEMLREESPPADPLGQDLGRMRILRASPLTPVPAVCVP